MGRGGGEEVEKGIHKTQNESCEKKARSFRETERKERKKMMWKGNH